MKKDIKYEEAIRQLEDIVSRMEEGDMDIDILGEELKKAQALIKICKDKLTKTDAEIKKLLAKGWVTTFSLLAFYFGKTFY